MLAFDPRRAICSFRAAAITPAVLFAAPLVSFVVDPGAVWAEYPGIFFHLSLLLLVPWLDAPVWAGTAGYAWVVLDVLTGVLVINDVPHGTAWPVRLAGHIFAGIWIATTSLCVEVLVIRVVGVAAGVWLFGYTFVATVLPEPALGPAGVLTTAWFVLLAVLHKPVRPAPS
ncbi:hypothetical protein [Streptomyces sp. NPDC127033]|uniref:hypothetical protein n=1 Tax=Streptomyces sp. NPDC127033 TaxID=3347110 RepID=UPI003650C91D